MLFYHLALFLGFTIQFVNQHNELTSPPADRTISYMILLNILFVSRWSLIYLCSLLLDILADHIILQDFTASLVFFSVAHVLRATMFGFKLATIPIWILIGLLNCVDRRHATTVYAAILGLCLILMPNIATVLYVLSDIIIVATPNIPTLQRLRVCVVPPLFVLSLLSYTHLLNQQ